jgi:predicted transcriptional regulator
MDNYIYYRILVAVVKHKTISRTQLIDATSLHTYNPSPIDYLVERQFLKEVKDLGRVRYYNITKEGLLLHNKMFTFFETHEKLLKQLHSKLKIGVYKDYEKVIFAS